MPSLTDYPMDADDLQALHDWGDAVESGDRAAARAAIRRLKVDPITLKGLKVVMGADYIREWGLNTELADKEYGPGWLDRDI